MVDQRLSGAVGLDDGFVEGNARNQFDVMLLTVVRDGGFIGGASQLVGDAIDALDPSPRARGAMRPAVSSER